MAVFSGTWNSEGMKLRTHVTVCAPEYPQQARATVILLHGLSGNCDDWLYRTGLEHYARKHALAFVLPEVQRSWYADMAYGPDYFGYVSEELIPLISHYFHLPTDREHLYIGGLSMGGYGTIRCALTHPERYKGAMSFSARVYMDRKVASVTAGRQYCELQGILGLEREVTGVHDTHALVKSAAGAEKKPQFYVACGTEDALYPESVDFSGELKDNGFSVAYEEWAGAHSWTFWREALPRGLKALGLME